MELAVITQRTGRTGILNSRKKWIKSQKDIMIPVMQAQERVVALDGHTRLRPTLDLGYGTVYVYPDDSGEYITRFVDEAIRREIRKISDMELVGDEEYQSNGISIATISLQE